MFTETKCSVTYFCRSNILFRCII
uniref:Uncharacterized protein n=1 Tax=Heterorhabditis bacteriophora TaxID=37862 RepID=A0A1I7WWR9_HETBA